MQCEWLGERVAAPSLRTVVRNVVTKEAAGNWGPNALFRFPTRGGSGGIWTAVADLIPSSKFRLGESGSVKAVYPMEKIVEMADGRQVRYKHLVSTMPVDGLLDRLEGVKTDGMKEAAKNGLVYSSTIVLGIGLRGKRPERIGDKCEWSLSCRSRTTSINADLFQAGSIFPRTTHLSIAPPSSPTTRLTIAPKTPLDCPPSSWQIPHYLSTRLPAPRRDRTGASCSRSANRNRS